MVCFRVRVTVVMYFMAGLSEGNDQGVGRCDGTALAQGLGLQHHAAVTHCVQFGIQLGHIVVGQIIAMQGQSGMDVGGGKVTLGDGVAAHLSGGNAGQVRVVHVGFRLLLVVSLGWLQLLATERISTGWCKPVKHYLGKPDKSLGLLVGWSGKLVDADIVVRLSGVAVHLYMSPMPVVLCTEVLKDV